MLLTLQGFAQYSYIPYYGKSRVKYDRFEWEFYETEHFTIYYYTKDLKDLQTIADMSESAYQTISLMTKHELSARVPLLYYLTVTDMEQSNLFPVGEGVLGISEPLLYRVGINGDIPPDELQNLIEHELTHIFEFDLLWGSPGGVVYSLNRPPDWVFEGFSEYTTEHWSSWSKLAVRDAVLNDRIPEMNRAGNIYTQYPMVRPVSYDFGHAIYEYIESKYGKNGVKNFWQAMKNSPLLGRTNPIKKAFNKTPKEFGHEFKKYLRAEHKKFLLRENPEDYSITMGPEFPLNEYWFAFSHALSPSGDIIAVMTYNVLDYEIDVLLISAHDGSTIKNLTKGYTLKYDYIKFDIEPSNGCDLAWSSDGDQVAFFARDGNKYSLLIIDPLTGKMTNKVKIPLDKPSAPCYAPNNKELIFTAFKNSTHDIFKISLEDESLENLTKDGLYEKAPMISPDGKQVAYTIRTGRFDKIYLSPLDDLTNKTQVTFGDGNDINPQFTSDSKKIFFSGDVREAYNIYSIALDNGEVRRYTDVRTGNFYPNPIPSSHDTVVFAAYNKGSFQIFKSELEGEIEKTVTFSQPETERDYNIFEPQLTIDIDPKKVSSHKGMGKLYMVGRPPVDVMIATDGSIFGGSSLAVADLFQDNIFTFTAYQVQSFRSYYFSYLNQKNRLQYMANAYHYTMYYYTPFYSLDPTLYYRMNYQDAIATRSITGVNLTAFYPFNRFYRIQGTLGYSNHEEDYYDPYMYSVMGGNYANSYFWNGNSVSASLSLVGETTHFRQYGPAKGNTFRLGITQALPISESFLRNTTLNLDFRQYLYLGADFLTAFRFNGFMSRGKNPYISYFGGNNTVRSSYYYSMIGNEGWYANLEVRYPLINAASTIIGVIGPIRGTLFFDVGRTKLKGYPALMTVVDETAAGSALLKQVEATGSYGFGFELFFMGFPLHFDIVKALDWTNFSKPFDWETRGNWMLKFWIGYDF